LERFGSLAVCALNAVYGYSCSVTSDSLKAYNYDAVGNRTDRGTYATGNRILTWVGGFTFEHDLDGNVTRRNGGSGQDTYFYWSAEGRLDSVVSGSTRLHYSYDASGRLVRRQRNGTTERYFLWDGAQLVAELTAAGTQRIAEYAYYPGIDRPLAIITGTGAGTTRYFTQDVIGNVTGVVAGSSSFQGINYDAWGQHNVSGTLGDTNRLRWKGLVWEGDVTQLYYMRNRWYEPRTGRFLSEDPIGLEGGINAYLFAAADPIGGVDPLGLCGKERSERCQCILKDDPTGNPEHIDWVPCDGQPGLPGVGVVVFGDQFACYHGRVCVSGNSSGGRRHLRPVPRPPTPRERELAMFITPLQQPIGCGAGVLMTVASGALDIAFFGAVVDVAVGAVRSLAGAFRWALGGGGVSAEPVQQFARGWIRAHEELPPHGVGVTVGVVGTGTASGGDFVPGATTYRFASFAADQCGIL
jgi:RHS repeat-associated protein